MVTLRGLARAGGARILVGLGLPLAVLGALASAGVLAWGDVARARTTLLWLALLAVAMLARALASVLERRPAAALAALAGACVVAQGGISAARSFDVALSAGEGEEGPPMEVAWMGRAARVPAIVVRSLPAERGGKALVSVDGREQSLPIGLATPVGSGVHLTVEHVYAAPTFVVRWRQQGKDEDVLQVKLRPAERDYFEAGVLPHRFHVTLPPPPSGLLGPTPPKIHLMVQRGKLKVLEREFARAEPARFEGIELGYGDGARWAVVRVRSRPRPWLAGAGVLLAAGAAATWLVRRRRT